MITNISLENFKCFRQLDIDPKLITVLIGPNGSGKSGVLQALMLLKQFKGTDLDLDGELVRFAPEDFVFHGLDPASNDVQMSLSGYWPIKAEGVEDRVEFQAQLSYSGDAILRKKSGTTTVRIYGQKCELHFDNSNNRRQLDTPRGSIFYQSVEGINRFKYSDRGESERESYWERVSSAPSDTLANMRIVPAARALSRGLYKLGPEPSVGISSAGGLGKQEEDIATTLGYSRREVEKVSSLMKRVTGVGFRTDTVPPQSVMLRSESPAGEVSLVSEGFGTNALVSLLFELVRAVPGATVLMEEPEVHLHPKGQADLASVLVEEARNSGKQLIMTTHSEHIAGRLLTLVAENELSPDELAIFSFEKDKDGVCSANEIEVTGQGQVKGGLKSFFEADLDEMRRYVDALRARA